MVELEAAEGRRDTRGVIAFECTALVPLADEEAAEAVAAEEGPNGMPKSTPVKFWLQQLASGKFGSPPQQKVFVYRPGSPQE